MNLRCTGGHDECFEGTDDKCPYCEIVGTVLYQVTAPHYCAGFEVDDRMIVVSAAPILRWTIGSKIHKLMSYFERKGFKLERL